MSYFCFLGRGHVLEISFIALLNRFFHFFYVVFFLYLLRVSLFSSLRVFLKHRECVCVRAENNGAEFQMTSTINKDDLASYSLEYSPLPTPEVEKNALLLLQVVDWYR